MQCENKMTYFGEKTPAGACCNLSDSLSRGNRMEGKKEGEGSEWSDKIFRIIETATRRPGY